MRGEFELVPKSLGRVLLKIAIACLAVVGAGDLAGRGVRSILAWRQAFGPPADVAVYGPLFSPDGQFKVIEFMPFGGGGLSPYCNVIFSILRAAVPNDVAWKDTRAIASFPCLGMTAGGIGHGVTWVGDHRLRIVLNLTTALQHGRVKLKPRDATGEAFLEYADR